MPIIIISVKYSYVKKYFDEIKNKKLISMGVIFVNFQLKFYFLSDYSSHMIYKSAFEILII